MERKDAKAEKVEAERYRSFQTEIVSCNVLYIGMLHKYIGYMDMAL